MSTANLENRERLRRLTATVKDVSREGSKAAELAKLLAAAFETLDSIGDDAQLANVDLQNILQKQQQTLEMLASISKTLYDTALAVIRKIGG